MIIKFQSDREQFVRALVQAGPYASEGDVIAEALQLLEEHNKLAVLRQEIAIGIDQVEGAGE